MIQSKHNYYQHLFIKYYNNSCTKHELQELVNWANSHPSDLESIVKEHWGKDTDKIQLDKDALFNAIMVQAKVMGQANENLELKIVPIKRKKNIKWLYAAAAILLLFSITIGIKTYNTGVNNKSLETVKVPVDILPGSDKAILTLADGSTIILDSANNGAISIQGNVSVVKLTNGELAYQNEPAGATEIVYNTITVPRGGQYRLILADGTKVWLNAASSLRFPASFVGNERRVELIGEGYFEVTKSENMPFFVSAGTTNVQVLGTHFNVNTYKDNGSDIVSLFEGLVKVSNGINENTLTLKPGQKATFDKTGSISVSNNNNIEDAIAWVNNYFIFENSSLNDAMSQLARWYDIKAVYNKNNTTRLYGRFKRSNNLSDALEILKAATGLKFDIEGREVVICE